MTHRILRSFLGLLLLTSPLGLAGCDPSSPPAAPEAAKVTVMHPEQREASNSLEFNGWMQPDKIQEVRARVRGHIKKVNFTDGQMVKVGDPLIRRPPPPFPGPPIVSAGRCPRKP